MNNQKAFLIILDGWGHGQDPEVSAIASANTPYVDALYENHPNAELITYGLDVGLPEGQMGNSEVGHLNIGAGRVVYQALAKINKAIQDDTLATEQEVLNLIQYSKANNKPVHLLGLLSDGGVHSHINHIISLSKILSNEGIEVFIHAFLDGRDTAPTSGAAYLTNLLGAIESMETVQLSSVIGRYYAMDRDNRWERIKLAYDLMVKGVGLESTDIIETVKSQYAAEKTDEFMPAIKLLGADKGLIEEGDAVLFANFRTDRPRQITRVLTQDNMPDEGMTILSTYFLTMTEYDESFEGVNVIYKKEKLQNTLGEFVASQGKTQLRIAETEKYPHVTFFFSGGKEEPFEGESRILVNSPKVATYDLQPEMSAFEVTDKVEGFIMNENPDLVILNYANADMVGHTGDFKAAQKAAETLDKCLESLIPKALDLNYVMVVIADHGNSDYMINPDGSPHTAHTTNPVPVILIDKAGAIKNVKNGKLADVAPTLLEILGIEKPVEMTGESLI